jgi:hypothetical protein
MDKIEFLQNQNIDLSKRCEEFRIALRQCIKVLKGWHGSEAFEIYYNYSPEMKLIRKALPK